MHTRTRRREATFLLLACLALVGCRAADSVGGSPELAGAEGREAIAATLEALYTAFCFDPGGEADWAAQRRLFAEGAAFVAPFAPGETPQAVGTEEFLADFRTFTRSSPVSATGLHERITHTRIDRFGGIAHAFVVFEAFAPGRPVSRRGLDSIQLVRAGERWLVASFTTQYETAEAVLQECFPSP